MLAAALGRHVSANLDGQVAHEVDARSDEVEHGGAVGLQRLGREVVQALHPVLLQATVGG